MVASTDIKFFVHTNSNAPQLQNAYGAMINVLDACLVDGINIGTVSSLTASGTTVTALFSTSHNLMQYQVIKITGAAQSEFNGEHRVLTVPNAQSVTFELAAPPSVSTATGTITASLPPLGWEKPFSSVNANGGGKAAYRSTNLLLPSRPFLRVVDELDPAWTSTYAKYAKVGIVEEMTDIDTMLGVQAPYDSAVPNKNWVGSGSGSTAINGWAKWYYARNNPPNAFGNDTTSPAEGTMQWLLVGTTDYFYILPSYTPSNIVAAGYGFGAFKSLLKSDSGNVFLSAHNYYGNASASIGHNYLPLGKSSNDNLLLIQRGYAQTAQYVTSRLWTVGVNAMNSGAQDYIGAYNLTNIAPFLPFFINETVLRGEMPNIYYLMQLRPYSNLELIENDNSIYIAKNLGSSITEGQIILKIGDL